MSFAFGLLAVLLKGTLAEATAVLLMGLVAVTFIVGVSRGLDAIGFAVVLKATTLGGAICLGIMLGLVPGYVYWASKWRRLFKGRTLTDLQQHPKDCLCECKG